MSFTVLTKKKHNRKHLDAVRGCNHVGDALNVELKVSLVLLRNITHVMNN